MATLVRCLISLNGKKSPKWYQAGDSNIYPSYVVETDDADEVTINGATPPIGIAGCPTYKDLNTAYTAGERLPVWMRGCGVSIYVLFDDDTGATTLNRGIKLCVDDANDGCVQAWGYVDSIQTLDDTLRYVIGTLEEEVTISGDTPTFVPCRMGL